MGPLRLLRRSEGFQSSDMAVINGISNACGVRIYELPALPAKVKAGLDALAAGKEPEKPKKYFLGSELYEELENIRANPVKFGGDDFFVPLGGAGERFF